MATYSQSLGDRVRVNFIKDALRAALEELDQ
jgi:hypothetical protein